MKILGHPVHLMLLHFPAALFPMECLLYGVLVFTQDSNFAFASFCILVGGVSLGWVAAVFGALDMASISSEREGVIKKALLHGAINGTILVAYTVITYLLYMSYPVLPEGNIIMLGVKLFLVLLLVVGNFIGGNLVLKDKVGLS